MLSLFAFIQVLLPSSRVNRLNLPSTETDDPCALVGAMTNDEIIERCKTAPKLPFRHIGGPPPPPIYVLSPSIVVKTGCDLRSWEARTMELVRSKTAIPVPRVLRYFEQGPQHYLVMEYIPGISLDVCWNSLSIWRKLWITWKLRSYVRQLRSVRTDQIDREVPGPVTDDPSRPFKCHCPNTGEGEVGPFHSKSDLARWANGRVRLIEQVWGGKCTFDPFDDSEHLVLTHGDIAWRNIILGDDGKLWLIDWGSSGVYPPWFEYTAMGWKNELRFWTYIRRFVTGAYPKQERFRRGIGWALGIAWAEPNPPTPPATD
ncbi:hypothetical protein CERSUDRAFT_96918 [Gelatoporia subvermispora B]|uniref:Aminoglycoside phosphotransferase domain-containing protein n=1 Tax=Ceriporiopsis subvermispora (strain B) TaxID=914234 RepID=M2PGA2_CERS8|nr:hypothetical protein CERSUDRAFT_96918 [Gelatoporia subvermispora B]